MTAYPTVNPAELPQFNGSFLASAWDIWYSYSDRACQDTATVYRWYYQLFFSEAASRRYEWIGQMIACGIALVVLYTQRWADATVAECLPTETAVEADPFAPTVNPHYPAMAATISQPVAVAVVKVEAPKPVTSAELRCQCQAAGIKWRNAHGQGRHMSKGEMIAALA